MDSIYSDDRVEKSIDTSDDIFDDVFGEDDEKKAARKRMMERLKEKNKADNKKEIIEEDNEPELFLDTNQINNIKENKKPVINLSADTIEEDDEYKERVRIKFKKKKSDFNKQVRNGLEKSIAKGSEDVGGKLNITIKNDEEKEEQKQKIEKTSPIEKNIIKNVIKNKAAKVLKQNNDLEEKLLKEQGVKEEGIDKSNSIAAARELIRKEDIKNKAQIKPELDFLMSEQEHAYIGRKKSVLKKYGEEAGLFIGRVEEEDLLHTPVYLDGMNPHVVFVCGARGSGKSYVLGVIAEELALKNKNVGIVVIDPIGVFWSMKHPNKEEKELEILADWGIMPQGLDNIKVFIPVGMKGQVPKSTYDSTFAIQPSLLTAEDWCLTFGIDRFSPTGLLMEKGIANVKKGYTTKGDNPKQIRGKENTFSLEDLILCFTQDSELNDRDRGYKTDSIRALISRFDAAKSWGIFSSSGTPLSLLSRSGQMTILDTSFLEENVSALVVGILARRLLQARKLSTRRESSAKFADDSLEDLVELNIPPTWLFIDEAHTLIPGGNQKTPASNALVEYVKQGRRPGLSLVFATQQPSSIDSKVLSQLDIIMAHKLVFDDDVKAIYKRTPTIIPKQYKKPNFIKTRPVGIALTGDRQETTTRAFVMGIRPRMSQHEGRDAETVEIKHDLPQDQVEKLALNIIMKQLEKDPSISIASLEQTLDTLNNTYGKQVVLATILALLDEKEINYDEERIYATGVKEEIEAEKEEELQENASSEDDLDEENNLNEKDESNDELKENKIKPKYVEPEYEENIELSALKETILENDARKKLVKFRQKKKFGLFGEEEILDRLTLKYGIIYKVKYNYFSQKEAYQVGEAYVNSLTGEFIHDIKGDLIESRGLKDLIPLKDIEIATIKMVGRGINLTKASELLGMDQGNAKRILDSLVKKGLLKSETIKEEIIYYMAKQFDLPANPLNAILPSVGKRPIVEVETISMIPPKLEEKEIAEILKKLWRNISIKAINQLYLPVWEGVLKKKTGEERIVKIDAINGKQII